MNDFYLNYDKAPEDRIEVKKESKNPFIRFKNWWDSIPDEKNSGNIMDIDMNNYGD